MSQNTVFFLFVLLMIACLSQFASDIYAPALNSIAIGLHSSINSIQKTMAIYMFGIAVSQLVYGVFSEAYGRKKPLIFGLLIMLLGSIYCISASTLVQLQIGRLLQGIGAGASAALWRPIFRDCYSGCTLSKYSSYLTILVSFFIPLAPAIGGYASLYFGWRSIFTIIAIYTVFVIFLVSLFFEETNLNCYKNKLKISHIKKSFLDLFTNQSFMSLSLCTFLIYGSFFTLYIVVPVFMLRNYNMLPSHIGLSLLGVSCIAMFISGYINGKCVERLGITKMLRLAFCLIVLSGLSTLIINYFFGVHLIVLLIFITVFQIGAMMVFSNIFAKAFDVVGHIAGYAGSVYSLIQIGGAAILGWCASYLSNTTIVPLTCIILFSGMLGWFIFEKSENSFSKTVESVDNFIA